MSESAIEIALSTLATLFGEFEPSALANLRAIVEAHGVEHVQAVLDEIEKLARVQACGQPLTPGQRWVMYRRDGKARTVGGRFFVASRRRIDRAAKAARQAAREQAAVATPTPTPPPAALIAERRPGSKASQLWPIVEFRRRRS